MKTVVLGQPIPIDYKNRTATLVVVSLKQCPLDCHAKIPGKVHPTRTKGCMSKQVFP
jgi:hypothetical protein